MIEVKLADFEQFRPNLLRYASGLLRTRGFSNHKQGELNELAKDVVQDTYLRFHKHYKDAFVNTLHLENFLKLCLYRQYQEVIDSRRRGVQYIILKKGNIDFLDINKHPIVELTVDEEKDVARFKELLTENQLILLDKLLKGYNMFEISREHGCSRQAIHSSVQCIRVKYEEYKREK